MVTNIAQPLGIDMYKSSIYVEAGLRRASLNQNEWFMGEAEHQKVGPIRAETNWDMKHARDFTKRFNANRNYILNYVQENRESIKSGKSGLEFTDDQFRHLILEDHSDYRPNQALEVMVA